MKRTIKNLFFSIIGIIALLIVFVFVMLALTACPRTTDYPYRYEKSTISHIELVDVGCVKRDDSAIRATYPIADVNAFLADFEAVDCYSYPPAVMETNSRVIKITYPNGDYDLVGSDGVCIYKFETDEIRLSGIAYFDREQYEALIERYSPKSVDYDICEYSFLRDESEIGEIKIIELGNWRGYREEFTPKSIVAEVNVETFLEDFKKVECRSAGGKPHPEENSKIVFIRYKSGEYEYIGAEGYVVFSNEVGVLSGDDCKCFDKAQFAALIEKYSK